MHSKLNYSFDGLQLAKILWELDPFQKKFEIAKAHVYQPFRDLNQLCSNGTRPINIKARMHQRGLSPIPRINRGVT